MSSLTKNQNIGHIVSKITNAQQKYIGIRERNIYGNISQ